MTDRILVVDDEEDTLNLVKMLLAGEKYEVLTAGDGNEAVQKALRNTPDIILLDLVMPGKSGLEVCKELRSHNRTKLIPIVMFTVLGRDIDRRLSAEAGADAHLMKPFTTENLLTTLTSQIKLARGSRFSKQLGLEHGRVVGREILLEFDPSANYERVVRDFAFEGVSHKEQVLVLTRSGSVVEKTLKGEEGIELIELTSQTLLSPILESHSGKPLALVLDSITDLVLSSGFQSAYNITRNILKQMSRPKATSVFLLSPSAHETREIYSFRGLFSDQILYNENGVSISRLS